MLLCARMINPSKVIKTGVCLLAAMMLLAMPAQSKKLSDEAFISLLTCGHGKPLYAAFGHTAIRVNDPVNRIDRVYNFGTFDFETSGFYFKFLLGKLDYTLSVGSYKSFYEVYVSENRTIYEQNLLLDNETLNLIYASLEKQYLPENRNYRYNFFEDNCTTRVLDIINEHAGNARTGEFFDQPATITFRQGLRHYINHRPWLQLGINLMLGPFADKNINNYQNLFLPDNLMHGIIEAGWADEPKVVYQGMTLPTAQNSVFSPMIVFWLLMFFFVAEIIWLKTSRKTSQNLDYLVFILAGITGLLFLMLWLFSDHISLKSNLNMLWANPLNLIIILFLLVNRLKGITVYLIIYTLMIFFLIINWSRLPQQIPLDAMPVVAILAFRSVQHVFQFVKKPLSSV